jgi:hypothetical protein
MHTVRIMNQARRHLQSPKRCNQNRPLHVKGPLTHEFLDGLIKFLHQRMGFDVLVWESGSMTSALSRRACAPVKTRRRRPSMRVPKFDEVRISDPTQPYDGLCFISRM